VTSRSRSCRRPRGVVTGPPPSTPEGFKLSARESLSQPGQGHDFGLCWWSLSSVVTTSSASRPRSHSSPACWTSTPLAVLYGPSGSGKTFVALDWALSVATGSWWFGHEVTSGPVLYVAAEGVGGLGIRVRAWQEHRRTYGCGETNWLPLAANLLDKHSTAALVDIASELRPVLVVFDTLARWIAGGDENSPKDMGLAVEAADSIRRVTGACVLLVHHTGKDIGAGARGHSSLKGAVTTEVECSSEDTTVIVAKQKGGEGGEVIRLSRVQVLDSCALEGHRGAAGLPDKALDLLAELAAIDTGDGVSSTLGGGQVTWHRSFYRWQKGLIEEGYCHKAGEKAQARFTVTEQGKQALENR
jgi:hypothetical protein